MDEAVDRQGQATVFVRVERPAGALQRATRVLSGILGPPLLDAKHMPLRQPRARHGLPRYALDDGIEHLPRPLKVLQGQSVHQRDGAKKERIALESRQGLRLRAIELYSDEGR